MRTTVRITTTFFNPSHHDHTMEIMHMAKGLTISSIVIAVLVVILFLTDLIIQFPFRGASMGMDIAFVICGLALAFTSWTTLKDLR